MNCFLLPPPAVQLDDVNEEKECSYFFKNSLLTVHNNGDNMWHMCHAWYIVTPNNTFQRKTTSIMFKLNIWRMHFYLVWQKYNYRITIIVLPNTVFCNNLS